jgi:hypothetical protein
MPKKDAEKWKYAKGSSCSGDQTSTQKLALAKPLKQCRKFGSLSSRLSVTEKICLILIHLPLMVRLLRMCHTESTPVNLLFRSLSQNLPTPLLQKVPPHRVLLFICLKAIILTFGLAGAIVKPVVALTDTGMKDLVHGGVHVNE